MRYRFSDIEIDAAHRTVHRGGRLVAVEPKVFDLLLYLIRHRDRVVSKAELLDALWPELDVMEGALAVAIHRARRLAHGIPAIKTVARSGYSFAVPVREAASTVDSRQAGRGMVRAAGFVGRVDELDRIANAIDTLGSPRRLESILVTGEPGIGKTRLLEEVSRYARGCGVDALWARASESVGAVTFPLWRQLVAAYEASRNSDDLRRLLGEALDDLAPLLPRVRRSAFRAGEASYARLRLFDAIVTLFARAATAQPLALLFDDLHMADPDSLLVLGYLARSIGNVPLVIIGTHRERQPDSGTAVAAAIATLSSSTSFEELPLDPLRDEEVNALLEHLAGATVPPPVADVVKRGARGNPLSIEEHWHLLVQHGAVVRRDDRWVHGRRPLRDALPAIGGLGAEGEVTPLCRRVLSAIAILGRLATAARLTAVSGASVADVHVSVAEAVRAGLIAPAHKTGDVLRFVHPAVADRVYCALDEVERAALHRRAGEVLLKTSPRDVGLNEIAHHFLAGIDAGSAARAITYAQRAGHRAFMQLAFAEAARYFERGLAALERFQPDDRTRRWELMAALGETYIQAGDEARARDAFRLAVSLASSTPETAPPTPASANQSIHLTRFLSHVRMTLHVPADESMLAAAESVADRQRLLERTARAARRRGDAAGLTLAVLSRRWSAFTGPCMHQRLPLSTEALFLAEGLGNRDLVQEARLFRIHDLLEQGRIGDVDVELGRYVRDAEQLGEPVYGWVATYLRSMRAQLAGRLIESERLAEEAFVIGLPAVGESAGALLGSQMMGIRSYQGRAAELLSSIEAFAFLYPRLPVGQATLATLYAELGRTEDARRAFEQVAERDFVNAPISGVLWLSTVAGFARVCAHLGDAGRAAMFYEQLLPYRAAYVVLPLAVSCLGSVAAYLAVFASTAGRFRAACDLFDQAIEANAAIGAYPISAHAQYEYARALIRHGGTARRRSAVSLLSEAEAVARDFALSGLLCWIEGLRRSA